MVIDTAIAYVSDNKLASACKVVPRRGRHEGEIVRPTRQMGRSIRAELISTGICEATPIHPRLGVPGLRCVFASEAQSASRMRNHSTTTLQPPYEEPAETQVNQSFIDYEQPPQKMANGENRPDEEPRSVCSVSSEVSKKKTTQKKNGLSKADQARFDAWYATFPNKTAKGAAVKAWQTLSPDDEQTALMVQAVDNQIAWRARMKAARQFVPQWCNPSTWLNQQRWEDVLTEPEQPQAKHDAAHSESRSQRYKRRKLKQLEDWRARGGGDRLL